MAGQFPDGDAPAVLLAYALVAGSLLATRLFRWE